MLKRLSLFLIAITTFSFAAFATINVPNDFTTIQQALNSATTFDTITVSPGIYNENLIWPKTNGIHLISLGDSSFQ